MNSSFITRLQTLFGVTKTELTAVVVILSGLLIYTFVTLLSETKNSYDSEKAKDIYSMLDSLAEVQRSTYIGTDMMNKPDSELVARDTIVKKESYFPKSQKKEMPENKININTASKVQLMKLPGMGEKTAIKIIEYR